MKKFYVMIRDAHDYEIEAETEQEAFKLAEKQFRNEVSSPIANTIYDDYDIEEVEE